MQDKSINVGQYSKRLREYLRKQLFEYAVTVCTDAEVQCSTECLALSIDYIGGSMIRPCSAARTKRSAQSFATGEIKSMRTFDNSSSK